MKKLLLVLTITTLCFTGLVACGNDETAADATVGGADDSNVEIQVDDTDLADDTEAEFVEGEPEEVVAPEETSEDSEASSDVIAVDVANPDAISAALPGTTWTDASGTTYAFNADASSLDYIAADGLASTGTYSITTSEAGEIFLNFAVGGIFEQSFYVSAMDSQSLSLVQSSSYDELILNAASN